MPPQSSDIYKVKIDSGLADATNAGYKLKHSLKYLVKSLVVHTKR